MGLYLEDQRVIIVKLDHPGVILEHGKTEILIAHLFADFRVVRWMKDLNRDLISCLFAVFILIMHGTGKDLVFAVFRPGLGQTFQLHIGRLVSQPHLPAFLQHLGVTVMALDNLHLIQRQGPPFLADTHQLFIRHIQVNGIDFDLRLPPVPWAQPAEKHPGAMKSLTERML